MKNLIWNKLMSLRGEMSISKYLDTRNLELIGSNFGIEKLDEILQNKELLHKLINMESITAPAYVNNFIQELLNTQSYKSVLDPWLTIASPMLYIQADNPTGICLNHSAFEIISTLFKDKSRNFRLGETFSELSKIDDKFDLIISYPPFGLRTQNFNGLKNSFDFATNLLLKCGEKVDQNGRLIFLVTNAFFNDNKIKDTLISEGLFVDSIFSIPSGAFSPMTGIASNIILVSKKALDKTFVAEISQDENINKTILQNFKDKKEGKAIQLGHFVDFKDYVSFKALISEREMQDLAKRTGYQPVLLTDISIAINALKVEDVEDVLHLTNSFYLPKVGNSPVVASLSELKIKPKNYYQIQLDDTIANSIYVANYFNTPVGKKLRESLEAGAVIPQISKMQLSKCLLFLPDLNSQAELIELDSKIQQFAFRLEELKRNLWKQPKSYKSIAKELQSINKEEKLENWIDNLPFPISSILWRYYATKDNGKKIEHLLHFFEAFSEFLSMIMLSALVQDNDFYKSESPKWIDKDEKFKNWYLKATFGNWNNLTSKLSKAIREYLADKDKKEFCKNLFGNPSDSFLQMLTSKYIVNILFEVANLRNKWKGHGGISSEEENKQRVLTLEQQLNEFKKYIADAFDEIKMLSPTTSIFDDGIYTFNAKELSGARTPFNEISVKSNKPLGIKKLYLFNTDQLCPLELLPFVKYIEASNAIYFYTSIESKDVRWVSYHFDKEAEINQPADGELFKTFEFLKQ